jgi:hypothetical protein
VFSYKPDYEDARRHWEAFWNGDMLDRPCTRVLASKDGMTLPPHPPGLRHPEDDLASAIRAWDNWASCVYFGGDAVPFFMPNFGPDIYAAFLGADLQFAKSEGTSWAKPMVTEWTSRGLHLENPQGYWWDEALRFARLIREMGEGKFGAAVWDLHSNLDALSALRGPQDLCTDILDCPDDVEAAMTTVRRSFAPIYDGLYYASGMDKTGSSSWLPYYCEGKFGMVQCDFVCLISPEQARRFLYPALEEEVGFLDRCCYHLDGPGALVHLDDILSIERIDSVQWVPGEGNPPVIEWMDLLKRIQAAGKSLYIAASVDQVKYCCRELRPEKVFYDVWAASQSEADALLAWLKTNT